MGLTHVAVRLFNSASLDTYEADFLVDTGAMDTMAPASELKKIGLQPLGSDIYELANGEFVEFEYGNFGRHSSGVGGFYRRPEEPNAPQASGASAKAGSLKNNCRRRAIHTKLPKIRACGC